MRPTLLLLLALSTWCAYAQKKPRPYRCGFTPASFETVRVRYDNYASLFGCQGGESIASVGAQSGAVEMNIACFVDSINWTLQDINATCLNAEELAKVKAHFQQLKGDSIRSSFQAIIGTETDTHLPKASFDRIILSNVFHELSTPDSILLQIHAAMKPDAVLVISEVLAKKPREKRKPCNHLKTQRIPFLENMQRWGYRMVDERLETSGQMTVLHFKKSTL